MASKVKEAAGTVERILLPRLNSIDGELKAINTRIDSNQSEIKTELSANVKEIKALMQTNNAEVKSELKALNEKVDVLPRLAVLEAQMKELQRRK